jgi:uncharacterized membrane protein
MDDDEAREMLKEGAKQLGIDMEVGEVKAIYVNEAQMKCLMDLTRGERTSITIRSAFTGISIASIIIFIVGGGYGWLAASLVSLVAVQRAHYYRKQWVRMRDELMEEIRKTEHTVGGDDNP